MKKSIYTYVIVCLMVIFVFSLVVNVNIHKEKEPFDELISSVSSDKYKIIPVRTENIDDVVSMFIGEKN